MAIRVLSLADPHAENAASSTLARCSASNVLGTELRRYCLRQTNGCSVLVAGLRGSGKTTLVESSIDELIAQSNQASVPMLRPLRVRLLGAVLLPEPAHPSTSAAVRRLARGPCVVQISLDAAQAPASAEASAPPLSEEEKTRQRILEHFALGLHAALSRELVEGFRNLGADPETLELAAQLQIRLPEGPTPSELREFWRQAGVLDRGVIERRSPARDQGMRELAAASGIGYAYQRVSGRLNASYEHSEAASSTEEDKRGWELAVADLARPLAALATGVAVTAGTAGANGTGGPTALVLGALAALGATLVFKSSRSESRNEQFKRDFTFLPDTRAETLDRVLPALIERLKAAGLAPVVVVDELDKVQDLWRRHHDLLDHMKKLFAESVFTCLLVNRDFLEALERDQQCAPFGRSFSYFTRRTFISYAPRELHRYLKRSLQVENG